MSKLYLYGALAIAAIFLYFQFIGLVEDNAQKDDQISKLSTANELYSKQAALKSKLNLELAKEKIAIQNANEALKDDLKRLKTTPKQESCDNTPLPAGYIKRLLDRNN